MVFSHVVIVQLRTTCRVMPTLVPASFVIVCSLPLQPPARGAMPAVEQCIRAWLGNHDVY